MKNAEKDQKRSKVTIDYGAYEHYLENTDLAESERRQFLDAIWSIIVAFVDLGFEVLPAQDCNSGDDVQNLEQNKNISFDLLPNLLHSSSDSQENSKTKPAAPSSESPGEGLPS